MTKIPALVLLLAPGAIAASYTIVPDSASFVRLEVDKTGLLRGKTHVFTFTRFQGEVSYPETSVAGSTITFTIEAPGITCKDAWLSAKDLVKVQQYAVRDMLAVDRYKSLSFRSTSVVAQEPNVLKVMGMLTIRDVTKPVEVSVRLKPAADNLIDAEGTSSIKLTDFNLKPPSAALGTIGTKNEMRMSFRLKLIQSVPAPK